MPAWVLDPSALVRAGQGPGQVVALQDRDRPPCRCPWSVLELVQFTCRTHLQDPGTDLPPGLAFLRETYPGLYLTLKALSFDEVFFFFELERALSPR